MAENLTNTLLKADRIYCFSPLLFRAFFFFLAEQGEQDHCFAMMRSSIHISQLSSPAVSKGSYSCELAHSGFLSSCMSAAFFALGIRN